MKITRDEKGRFLKGANLGHPVYGGFNTTFKKGHKFIVGGEKGWFKKGDNYKGDDITKDTLHWRIEQKYGKPEECEICGTKEAKQYQWSNVSGKYKEDKSDWQRLCIKCHHRYDWEHFGARRVFYEH